MSRRQLFRDDLESPISPFIDVVVNAMGAMVIILIVYMLMVQPTPGLRLVTERLPRASWFHGYETSLSTTGGSGSIRFTLAPDALAQLNAVNLHFEQEGDVGWIRGTPCPSKACEQEAAPQAGVTISVPVEVRDDAEGHDSRVFEIEIDPVAIPFDPRDHPLEWTDASRELPDIWIGEPYRARPGVSGGIEPYTYTYLPPLPAGLEPEEGFIVGVVHDESLVDVVGHRRIRVHVLDQQNQFVPENLIEKPTLEGEFTFRVRDPKIAVVDCLSSSVRAGGQIRGAIVAQGGRNGKSWHWNGTFPPGLLADDQEVLAFRRSGVLEGFVSEEAAPDLEPVVYSVELWVEDEAETRSEILTCHITVLPKMHLRSRR